MIQIARESKIKIDNIDFTAVKQRLCSPYQRGGFEWTLVDAEYAIECYLTFLESVLNHAYEQSGRPIFHKESRRLFEEAVEDEHRSMVAIVWEAHVLNTRQYLEDCQRIFKCFLHYSPGLVRADEVSV